MDYTKVSFKINPDSELNREILVAYLSEMNFESFDENDDEVHGFISGEITDLNQLNEIINTLPFQVKTKLEKIPHQNWNEIWEKNYFKPLILGNKLVIRAPFHTEYPKTEYELVIEPQMAFGTGNHETTSQMAEEILENNAQNKTILDVGCGTGILGMLASLKGAKHITAIDIDKQAVESTLENIKLNKIPHMEVFQGDASLLENQKFDLIFANIHKNIIVDDLLKYNQVLANNGQIWLSGFYSEDIPDIKTKAESLGLVDNGFKLKNNWAVCKFIKKL